LYAAGIATAQKIEFSVLTPGVLEDRLRLASPKIPERYARLRQLFVDTGCEGHLREQKVPGSKQPNLICDVPGNGASAGKIIVGAHFDCAGGDGVIDNWTGAILMPSLADFIRRSPRKHSFEFIGFAAEEKGLWGSKHYLKEMKGDERQQVAAVIAMDSLGLTSTKVWPNSSTPELMNAAARLAASMKLPIAGVNVDGAGTTDSMVFKQAGMPVLSLHSVTQETWKLINSKHDVWKTISWSDYYDSHRFISALLVYLDETLP
jgi:hypothetical protein